MGTFAELKRQVLLRIDKPDGRTLLVVEQAINDVLQLIAKVKDFDELIVLDTTSAFTIASQKLYHIIDDLFLTRPKDIYSIRCMDESSSTKLTYVPTRELDDKIPYTEQSGIGFPSFYTVRGMYIELYRIPDDVYSLYIQHSQWPSVLVNGTDETEYTNIDDVIVSLSADATASMLEGGGSGDWYQRAFTLLQGAVKENIERPDRTFVARPFSTKKIVSGEYWYDPFYRGGN